MAVAVGGEILRPVSQENFESFHRGMDAWNRGDLEAWLEWLHPEVEWHPSAALVEGGAYHGREGSRRFWDDIVGAFDELVADYEEVRDLGDGAVLGLGRLRGRSRQGFPIDLEYALLVRFRDGLAVWGRSWFTHAEALEAVGAAE